MAKSLSEISTEWTLIEGLLEKDGPVALAAYLEIKYFSALTNRARKNMPKSGELEHAEIAAEVLNELRKNDYRGAKNLSRERRPLRGLFSKIIQRIFGRRARKAHKYSFEEYDKADEGVSRRMEIRLDLQNAMKRLQREKPLLYNTFFCHYVKGQKAVEIAKEFNLKPEAVRRRLYNTRNLLREWLKDYEELFRKDEDA